jgi:hypothetical protein
MVYSQKKIKYSYGWLLFGQHHKFDNNNNNNNNNFLHHYYEITILIDLLILFLNIYFK